MGVRQFLIFKDKESVKVVEQTTSNLEQYKDLEEVYTFFKGYYVSTYYGKKLAEEKGLKYEEIFESIN